MIINGELEIPKYKLIGINKDWIKPRLYAFGNDLIEIREIMNKAFNNFIATNFNEKCELQIVDDDENIIDSKIYPDDMV